MSLKLYKVIVLFLVGTINYNASANEENIIGISINNPSGWLMNNKTIEKRIFNRNLTVSDNSVQVRRYDNNTHDETVIIFTSKHPRDHWGVNTSVAVYNKPIGVGVYKPSVGSARSYIRSLKKKNIHIVESTKPIKKDINGIKSFFFTYSAKEKNKQSGWVVRSLVSNWWIDMGNRIIKIISVEEMYHGDMDKEHRRRLSSELKVTSREVEQIIKSFKFVSR